MMHLLVANFHHVHHLSIHYSKETAELFPYLLPSLTLILGPT